jgi:hypothetical protein
MGIAPKLHTAKVTIVAAAANTPELHDELPPRNHLEQVEDCS